MKNILINILVFAFCVSIKAQDHEALSDALLPKPAQHEQYQALFNIAYNYLEFCESTAERYRLSDYYDSKIEMAYTTNLETARKIITVLHQIDQGEETVDFFLREALFARLKLIERYEETHKQTISYVKKYGIMPPMHSLRTDRITLENLRAKVEAGDKIAAFNLAMTQQNIDRYQFFNLLIKLLFNLSDPQSLSPRTKRYISCSRTLWPLLLDETTDLSHPDFATIRDVNDPPYPKDTGYIFAHVARFEYPRILKNWGDHEVMFELTRYEISLEDPEYAAQQGWNNLLPLPRPSWLYPEKPINIPVSGIPKDEVKIGTVSQALPKAGSKVLSSSNQTKARHKTKSNKRHKAQPKNVIKKDAVQKTEQEELLTDKGDDAGPALAEGVVDLITTSIDQASQELKAETELEVAQPLEPQVLSEDESMEENSLAESEEELANITAQAFPKLQPRGVRLFHEQGTSSSTIKPETHHVNAKVRKIIDTIFDYRLHGQGFNFGDFQTVWEHINGLGTVRQSGSGSSHYALLNKEKKVVGGTFAHGNGHEYNQKTVRYLRAALNAVGIFSEIEQRP